MSRKVTPTYILLNQITLAATSTSVTFSNIPQNDGDLSTVMSGTASSTQGGRMVLNADTGSNYSTVRMYGTGSGGGNADSFTGAFGYIGDVFTNQTQIQIQLMDYSALDKHKAWLYRMDNAGNYTMAGAARYASTAAISTLAFSLNSGASYAAGTTFSLYGIAA